MISAEILAGVFFACFVLSIVIGAILLKTKCKNKPVETQLKVLFLVPLICMFCLIFIGFFWGIPCEMVIEEKSCDTFSLSENAVQLRWENGNLVGAQIFKNVNDVVLITDFTNVRIVNDLDKVTHLKIHTTECAQTIFGIFDCYHYIKVWAELI